MAATFDRKGQTLVNVSVAQFQPSSGYETKPFQVTRPTACKNVLVLAGFFKFGMFGNGLLAICAGVNMDIYRLKRHINLHSLRSDSLSSHQLTLSLIKSSSPDFAMSLSFSVR